MSIKYLATKDSETGKGSVWFLAEACDHIPSAFFESLNKVSIDSLVQATVRSKKIKNDDGISYCDLSKAAVLCKYCNHR